MLFFKDKISKPTGNLTVKVFKNSKLIDIQNGDNLIVDEGSDLLGNGLITNVTDDLVQTIGVGTGSSTPAAGDTRATFSDLATKSVAINTYDDVNHRLTYTFTIEGGEYNGYTIKEFGLFSNGPVGSEKLFARRVITGSIVKTSDIRVEGTWVIQF